MSNAWFNEGYPRRWVCKHFFDNEAGGSLHGQSQAGLTEFGYAAGADKVRVLNILCRIWPRS